MCLSWAQRLLPHLFIRRWVVEAVWCLAMWSLIRKDLGEFVTTLKDDAAVTIKSAMSHGEGEGEEYDSSVSIG